VPDTDDVQLKACRSTDPDHAYHRATDAASGLIATENMQTAASGRNMLTCLAGARMPPHMPK